MGHYVAYAHSPGRVHRAVPPDQNRHTAFGRPMAARDQARRLPHHCRQGRPASAVLQPSGQRSHSPFPLIVETLARLRSRSCIIDGEAVACDDNDVASFDLIRNHRHNHRAFLYAFDLIELNGDDLRRDPLEVRKAALASIVAKAQAGIRFSEHMEGDGEAVPRPCFGQPRQGPPARPAIPNHERGNHKSVSLASKALAPTGRTRPTSQAAQ